MMKENMKKIEKMTRHSIFEVFKKMFYVFLEPLDGEYGEYDMEAAIRFEGSLSGEIRILLSMDIVKAMIQNMLGLKEDEITTQRMEDCSKEAVNVVCGNFLGKLNSAKVFNLSMPVFSENNPPLPTFDKGGNDKALPFKKGGMGGFSDEKSRDSGLSENACRMDFESDCGKVGLVVEVNGRV